MATIYEAANGDFDAIQRGIGAVWRREHKYRPGHARGFVDEVRKAAVGDVDAKAIRKEELEKAIRRMHADPQYRAFAETDERKEQQQPESAG